mmetsp:Transcript_17654/g.21980  ORF Transcript_17654/g.21980 Transcript_17654/m.21980 type:complete len:503 (-) Transcript_17654:276-1784(-)
MTVIQDGSASPGTEMLGEMSSASESESRREYSTDDMSEVELSHHGKQGDPTGRQSSIGDMSEVALSVVGKPEVIHDLETADGTAGETTVDHEEDSDDDGDDNIAVSEATPMSRQWGRLALTHCFLPMFIIYGALSIGRDVYGAMSNAKYHTINDSTGEDFDGHVSRGDVHMGYSHRIKSALYPPAAERESMKGILANVADVSAPADPINDVAFFWITENMPAKLISLFSQCMPISMAIPSVIQGPEPSFNRVDPPDGGFGTNLDLNMGSLESVKFAYDHHIVSNTDVNLIASPHLIEAIGLYTSTHKARIFGLFPNVFAMIGSSYKYLSLQGLFNGTMLDFLASDHVLANNYITRLLSGRWEDQDVLTDEDYEYAEAIFREKFFMVPNAGQRELVEKMVDVFDWNKLSIPCIYEPAADGGEAIERARPSPKPKTEEELEIERLIEERNAYDNRLFLVAQENLLNVNITTEHVDHTNDIKGLAGALSTIGSIVRYGVFKRGID